MSSSGRRYEMSSSSEGSSAPPQPQPREVTSGGDASLAASSTPTGFASASTTGINSSSAASKWNKDESSFVVVGGVDASRISGHYQQGGGGGGGGSGHHQHPAISRIQRQSTVSNVVFRGKEKIEKIGHRRVNVAGVVSYKKTPADQLKRGIQMGLEHFIGQISNKPVRDLLIQDFEVIESVHFPSDGSQMTVAHGSSDFRFECFAPDGFKHFRQGFGIDPSDFLISLCKESLKDLSNPGASGSLFFLTDDDEFIIKTVDHKEAKFLKKLLPGYYMNLIQNPRTLLPKFYGLYCYSSLNKNIRLVIMNNLLPSSVKMHEKYDLKGSTFKRKASKAEREKRAPTLKDLDFMELHPKGIILGPVYRKAVMETIEKDCRVLESFNIMDFSLLLGIHNLDKAAAEEKIQIPRQQVSLDQTEDRINPDCQSCSNGKSASNGRPNNLSSNDLFSKKLPSCVSSASSPDNKSMLARQPSYHKKLAKYPNAFEVIQSTIEADGSGEFTNSDLFTEVDEDIIKFTGGIPARSEKGERLLLFLGLIDILQQYKLKKKMEHAWKAAVHDGNSVSVTRPDFYKQRFLTFISHKIFPKMRTVTSAAAASGAGGPRPSSSSIHCKAANAAPVVEVAAVVGPAKTTTTTTASPSAVTAQLPDDVVVVSPSNISITIENNSSSSLNRRVVRRSSSDEAKSLNDNQGNVDFKQPLGDLSPIECPSFFASPDRSFLVHDLTGRQVVAIESPSVHPPASSTPTLSQQQQQQPLSKLQQQDRQQLSSNNRQGSSRFNANEATADDSVFLNSNGASSQVHYASKASKRAFVDSNGASKGAFIDSNCASNTFNNATLSADNPISNNLHITQDSFSSLTSSLHANSKGIIGASSVDERLEPFVHTSSSSEMSPFDSSATSQVLNRIKQLEDSSPALEEDSSLLDSFVGDIPSELKIEDSSLMESIVEEDRGSRERYLQQQIATNLRESYAPNYMNSSSGVSSMPTSLVKASNIQAQIVDDENTDPTSSFFSSEKPQILTSQTSGLEEDTSGISGISPLEDPSSEPQDYDGGGGGRDGGGGGRAEPNGVVGVLKNIKISFDPPTSSSNADREEQTGAVF